MQGHTLVYTGHLPILHTKVSFIGFYTDDVTGIYTVLDYCSMRPNTLQPICVHSITYAMLYIML